MRFNIIAFLSLLIIYGCNAPETNTEKKENTEEVHAENLRIAVIPKAKGMAQFYWKSVHAGALKAAEELGVELIWDGPQKQDDHQGQMEILRELINKKVDGVVLAPTHYWNLKAEVKNISQKNIPVVIIDSQLDSDDYSSFIATDNLSAGKLCAQQLVRIMNGKGSVIMIKNVENAASTTQRETGFVEGLKEYGPEMHLISSGQYAGPTEQTAFQAAEKLLKIHPEVEAIFCPNESVLSGTLKALKSMNKAGKVKLIGFDSNPILLEAVKNGEIHLLAVQDPFKMGYLGVKTIVSVIKEEKYNKRINTGVTFVTLENLNDPEIQHLLHPEAEK